MRAALVIALLLGCSAAAVAQDKKKAPPPRYGVEVNTEFYPQGSPKEALASVLKTIDRDRFDYLVAQLLDPAFVDPRAKNTPGGFAQLVTGVKQKLADDPESLKELRRFLREGEVQTKEDTASLRLKDVKNRAVFFRRIGDRWYLENRQQEEKPADKGEEK